MTGVPSPELQSNWFSYLTWQWVQPLITLGNKKIIQAEDLYDLNVRESTEFAERQWLEYYERKKLKHGRPPPVWKLVFLSAGRELVISFTALPVWLTAIIVQVFLLRHVVQIAQERNKELQWWRALVLGLGMLIAAIGQSIGQHYAILCGQKCGMRIRSAVSMAVFGKLMKMKIVALAGTNTGELLNLITNDTQKLLEASTYFAHTCFGVVACIVVVGLAAAEVGVSALPGFVVIVSAQAILMSMAQAVGGIRKRSVRFTDARVRSIQEILSGIRVVKLNGWTRAFLERIADLRKVEIKWIRRAARLGLSTSTLREGIAPIAALATFGAYVGLHGSFLSATKAFTILGIYSILVRVYAISPKGALSLWEAKIGIQRLQTLMDLPDGKSNGSVEEVEQMQHIYPKAQVVVSNAAYVWNVNNDKHAEAGTRCHEAEKVNSIRKLHSISTSPIPEGVNVVNPHTDERSLNPSLKVDQDCGGLHLATGRLVDINLTISEGELIGIIGSVGSGKSSLLYALLGEMECLTGSAFIKAPVSYAPQQPWILNDTIRNNITFHSEYDEARYQTTIHACALNHDLQSMPAGDATEIGEKGVNLSGGQKARISLARACYRTSQVVLLDDPLAAVDVPTGRHLMQHVLDGILRDRTVILVTHNKSSLELCNSVYVMDDGKLQELKSMEDVAKDMLFDENNDHLTAKAELECRKSHHDLTEEDFQVENPTAALTVKEDRATGMISHKTYLDYARGSGLWLWAFFAFLICFAQALRVMVDYWVAIWVGSMYGLSTKLYFAIYAAWIAGTLAFTLARCLVYAEAATKAATSLHNRMTEGVLRSPQVFFDQNPVGRILNRFSKDQAMVDDDLPLSGQGAYENLMAVFGVLVFVSIIMPWILLSLPAFLLLIWYCQQRYVAVSRELRRLDGISRSPIYAHFSQTLLGVASIRAYQTEALMHDHFRDCIDANHRAFLLFSHTARWLGVRLDAAAALCMATVTAIALLLRNSISPGVIGVVLVQSLQLTDTFQYAMRMVSETENIFTAVERNQAYTVLPSEAAPQSPPGLIPNDWPDKGRIEFLNYTMAYRPELQPVLKNLTFTIYPHEKVGVVGRTGAGKSSLAAALFRMVENSACSGSIFVDNIELSAVGLDDLRLRFSIIPQDPVLFRGTVRLNLDPFQMHSDFEIFKAIGEVQLGPKIKSLEAGLDSVVEENGDNFSVGQRQLLCLARSLLRRSKIVVMDEATAAVDGDTDQLIQSTIRGAFHECTVLTIAHRIDTIIDCDRVLVLGNGGRIAEFDSPANLLRRADENASGTTDESQTEHGFAAMVREAGPAASKHLREIAEAAEQRRFDRSES